MFTLVCIYPFKLLVLKVLSNEDAASSRGQTSRLDWPGRALHGLPLTLANLLIFKLICEQGYRGIYCAKYYGQGGWEKMVLGKKMKNEAVRNKMKKKEKEEKEKGESDFFVNIWHTSVDHCILT